MVVPIILILIVLIALLIKALTKEAPAPIPSHEENKEPDSRGGELAGGISTSGKSLDAVYAEKNNFWVCCFCETLNPRGSLSCAACGKQR